jgi:hypothetical protein
MNQEPTEIDMAAYQIDKFKAEIDAAKLKLADAEDALIELVGCKPEGSTTSKTAFYKVTTTGRMNRRVDVAKLAEVQSAVPHDLYEAVFPYKPSLSTAGLRKAEKSEHWATIAQAITTTPGKPAVKIERINQE